MPSPAGGYGSFLKILGLILTGLAVSQGASFRFDLLNKFIVIRSTIKPHEKSREEGTKDKDTDDAALPRAVLTSTTLTRAHFAMKPLTYLVPGSGGRP